jgi:SAM-dependent methyltransferase
MKYASYWQGEDGIRNVKPGGRGEFPEGFPVISILRNIITRFPVIEIGCGYGRLAEAFAATDYWGLDCNAEAIKRARRLHPDHRFRIIDSYNYPPSMVKLAYTVAIHIPDEEYPQFIKAICEYTHDQVVIAEILGKHLRRKLEEKKEGWIQPTFGRNKEDHEREFEKNSFQLVTWHDFQYPGKGTFTFLDFRRKPNA